MPWDLSGNWNWSAPAGLRRRGSRPSGLGSSEGAADGLSRRGRSQSIYTCGSLPPLFFFFFLTSQSKQILAFALVNQLSLKTKAVSVRSWIIAKLSDPVASKGRSVFNVI